MGQLFEFFFNLLLTVWSNVEELIEPLLNFFSGFTEFALSAITNFLEWILEALEWIVDLFEKIGKFFGLNSSIIGNGGRPR